MRKIKQKSFAEVYSNLIVEMNQKDITNLAGNISFTQNVDELFSKNDTFEGHALPSKGYKYTSYQDWDGIELEEVELTNNKLAYVKIEDGFQIEYDWQPYEPQTWDYPGNPGGVTDIGNIGWPFSKDLNSDYNNDVIHVQISTDEKPDLTEIKFTDLPIQDRYLIFKAITEYFATDDFPSDLQEKIEDQAPDYDDYDDRY